MPITMQELTDQFMESYNQALNAQEGRKAGNDLDLKVTEEEVRAAAGKGLITTETSNGCYYYITVEQCMELLGATRRELRRVYTKIVRTAKSEYSDKKPNDRWMQIYLKKAIRINIPSRTKTPGFSMKTREGRKHIPYPDSIDGYGSYASRLPGSVKIMQPHELARLRSRTVAERLKDRWMSTEGHKNGDLLGIELEFCSDMKKISEIKKQREGACTSGCCPGIGPVTEVEIFREVPPIFRDISIPGVIFKTDSSVKPSSGDSAEANMLCGPNGFGRLRLLTQEIKKRGGYVNKSCGLHVHLDARHNERRVVGIRASKLYDAMQILKDLVPDSRLIECQCGDPKHKGFNHYCVTTEKPDFHADRYNAINLACYKQKQTIEVRLGAGSLNPSKIWHWASLLLSISNAKKRFPEWKDFIASDTPLNLKVWAINRAHELRPNESLRLSRMNTIAPGLDDVLKAQYQDQDKSE